MLSPAFYRRAIPAEARLSVWAAADGWPLRRFDWPVPASGARGSILFQGGRGDIIEKYLELFAHFHGRGWSVSAFDWRGQGGSGRLSPDPHVGHCDDFGGLIHDFERFWDEWSARSPGPRVVIGHSMGGHLVLRALLDGMVKPAAAVLAAPMLGLRSPVGARLGGLYAGLKTRIGDPKRGAWNGHERPGAHSRQSLLTHDAERYADELWWHAANPDNRLGPPSWAWVAESFASTRSQRADPRLDRLAVPLLFLVPTADLLVDPRAAIAIARRVPGGRLVTFGGESAHEVLREADPVRDRAIAAIDAFLDERAPAG